MNIGMHNISTASQLPGPGEIFLDHVAWMVPDMRSAASALLRLGFLLTPYSQHSNKNPVSGAVTLQGSANRLAMLERGYLEVLCALDGVETEVTRHLNSCLERYVGVHLVAFSVADTEKEALRLAQEGFDLQASVNLRRSVLAADGDQVEAAFRVVRLRFGSLALGRIQSLTHLTPEHLWQRRYISSDNAIAGLSGVIYASPTPAESAAQLARYTNRPARVSTLGSRIELDRGVLEFMTPQSLEGIAGGWAGPPPPSVAVLRFLSHDIEQARLFYRQQGVELLVDRVDRILVHPNQALGVALSIEAGANPGNRGCVGTPADPG